jgi:hypoxanthine phosphoribosyltransferase
MEKDIQEILVSEQQIKERIAQLGEELTKEYAGKNPVVIGVLKGVAIFYADMIRQIKVPCQMDFMCISSYKGNKSSGNTNVRLDLAADIRDRHVLILEDIFDTGVSLSYLVSYLQMKQPASVKICTLLDKPKGRKPGITLKADYVGFEIPDAFVVGYGLDFNEKYRNLPYVGVLKPEAYQA